jgi:hypothetical protein
MKKIIYFLFLSYSITGFSQTDNNTDKELFVSNSASERESKELNDRWNNALGSFQFQIIDSRINPSIPISTIEMIEKNRLNDKINYLDFRDHIRILILPKSTVEKDYKKLDLFKYINSAN